MDRLIKKILFEEVDIPAMPDIVSRILAVLEDRHASIKKIEDLVLKDQSLTANILRIANTPYFHTGKQITTLHEAIMSIGSHNLTAIVSMVTLTRQLMTRHPDKELMRHPYAVSIISAMLSAEISGIKKDEALIAGLLHDIGILLISAHVPSAYKTLKDKARTDEISFVQVENKVLGMDHCHIGSLLAKKWRLPHIYDYVIKHHHDSGVSREKLRYEEKLCYLVRVADHIVFDAGIGIGTSYEKSLPDLLSVLNIDKEMYENAVKGIREIEEII